MDATTPQVGEDPKLRIVSRPVLVSRKAVADVGQPIDASHCDCQFRLSLCGNNKAQDPPLSTVHGMHILGLDLRLAHFPTKRMEVGGIF
jgi:hypothetical protein